MESLALITKSKKDSSYSITKKGTDFVTQDDKLVDIIEQDLEKLNSSNSWESSPDERIV